MPVMSQTSIPVSTNPLPEKICAWCGNQANELLTLEPERYAFKDQMMEDGTVKRVKYLRKRAITAWICSSCNKDMVFRESHGSRKS